MAKKKTAKKAVKSAPKKMVKKDYSENKAVGLALGLLFAIIHATWLILVYIGVAKDLLDWVIGLHMIKLSYTLTALTTGKVVGLLILTFVSGYIAGWILAALLKMTREKR